MGGNGSRQSPGHDCLDEMFGALAHRHRRRILSRLFERSPLDTGELVPAGADDDDRERLSVELHHCHLPKLDAEGFIEWDGEGEVRRGPKFEAVEPFIALFDRHASDLPGEWP